MTPAPETPTEHLIFLCWTSGAPAFGEASGLDPLRPRGGYEYHTVLPGTYPDEASARAALPELAARHLGQLQNESRWYLECAVGIGAAPVPQHGQPLPGYQQDRICLTTYPDAFVQYLRRTSGVAFSQGAARPARP